MKKSGYGIGKAPILLAWFAFLLVCYAPPVAVLFFGATGTAPAIGSAPTWGMRRVQLLLNSLALALLVSGFAMVLAAPLAGALWRAPRRLARVAQCLLMGWIAVPPCVNAMAWLGLWSWANTLLTAHGYAGLPLTGWCAAGILQTFTFLPLAVALAWLGFESVDAGLLQAARMQRGEGAVFMNIALPLAAPALLAGGGLICLLSLLDFSLPSLCGVTVYTLDLFAEYSADGNARQTLVNALPLMILCALVVWLSQSVFRNAASTARKDRSGVLPERGGGVRICQALLWGGVAALLLAPLLALCRMASFGTGVSAAWMAARGEALTSLRIALAAALLSIPPSLVVAEALAGSSWRSNTAWFLTTLPLAIPPSLVGIGWTTLAVRCGVLQGSSWLPILACMTRFMPVTALILLVARRRLDPLLWDAARVFQADPWDGFRRVRLPLLGRGVLAAIALTVALTLGELGATLVVVAPGESTLTLRLYQFLHYGASAHVASLGLLLALLAASAGAAVGWLLESGARRRSTFPS
jgi:iron(III) transport system permease protein